MKKTYSKPEADKISFNYRDQVVAASGNSGGNSLVQNSFGAGSPFCGSGGLVDWVFDYFDSSMCR